MSVLEDFPKLVIESYFMNEKTDFQRDCVFRSNSVWEPVSKVKSNPCLPQAPLTASNLVPQWNSCQWKADKRYGRMISLERGDEIVKDALLETLSETLKRKDQLCIYLIKITF